MKQLSYRKIADKMAKEYGKLNRNLWYKPREKIERELDLLMFIYC